jgi:hypothetical protein
VPSREKSRQGPPDPAVALLGGPHNPPDRSAPPYVTAVFSDRKMAALITRWEPLDPNRMPV